MKYKKTNSKKLGGIPLAVATKGGKVFMLIKEDGSTSSKLNFLHGKNGVDFELDKKKVTIKTLSDKNEKIKICDRFSISATPNGYVMTYVRAGSGKQKAVLVVAKSTDLYNWSGKSELPVDEFHHTTVTYDKKRDAFDLFRDGLFIKHQSTVSIATWKERPSLLFTSRAGLFDREKLSLIGSAQAEDGIILVYDASVESKGKTLLQTGAVILDKNDPKKIIWRSPIPLWQGVVQTEKNSTPIRPLGFIMIGDKSVFYWKTSDNNLIVVRVPSLFREIKDTRYQPKILNRHEENPIIEPRVMHDWEGEGTFNPAAFEDDEGTIHLLYRAIGIDGISRVGLARSKNGLYFNDRLSFPIFEQLRNYSKNDDELMGYSPVMFTSGGSWTGAEDPRTVRIGKTVYMIYVVFDGWRTVPRLALTSISLEDFKAGRWYWKKPIKISPPNHFYKNWLLFPEKINGKFAIIHSIEPNVLVEYVSKLEDLEGKYINSRHPENQKERLSTWDSKIRGSGPPPMKTKHGWLLLYHATQKHEPHRYKVGAMLLDLKDPTKVLYRSKHPILSPDMHYENNGKPGVVYASGALIRDGELYVYYGGADKVCCVAKTDLNKLITYLQTGDAKPYELDETKNINTPKRSTKGKKVKKVTKTKKKSVKKKK